MANERRKYTPECRVDAVRLGREQGRTVSDVARSPDVHVNMLHGCVSEPGESRSLVPRRRSPEQVQIA